MFSNRTRPRSIASELVLLFTLAAAFLLTCGLGIFYLIVVRHAFAEDNQFLTDKLAALRADLNHAGGLSSLNAQLRSLRSSKPEAYWVRVIDSRGDIVAETPKMSNLLPANIFPNPQDNNSALSPKNYRPSGELFSLVATNEKAGGEPYVMQVAQDRSSDEQFATQFAALLAGALALGIVASSITAVAVSKRGLRPLQEMTRSLERIGPTHLHERVGPARWPRELQPVAVAFDEMVARLEDSFTRLSQFSADLAHELRTPISNIRGEAEVTLTRPRPLEEYRQVIESIAAECERLSGIVDNLLFLARAEGVDRQIERSEFAARPAVEKIAAYYRPVAEEQHVTIGSSGEGKIYADPLLFSRALSNLVENALRFTSDGGKIVIAVSPKQDRTEVTVKDTGSGIPAEHIPRIFDRFYRVDPSRSSHGAGLGLALVKSITDLHHGSAVVESAINRGTTVTLTFPAKPANL